MCELATARVESDRTTAEMKERLAKVTMVIIGLIRADYIYEAASEQICE